MGAPFPGLRGDFEGGNQAKRALTSATGVPNSDYNESSSLRRLQLPQSPEIDIL